MADSFVGNEETRTGDTIVRLPLRESELHECGAVVRGAPPFRSGCALHLAESARELAET